MPSSPFGRVVWYRSKNNHYTMPADVIAVQDSIYPPAVEHGFMEPLDSPLHVHLLVKTAGKPGTRLPDSDPSIKGDNQGGTYVEHNIPFWPPPREDWEDDEQPGGTWTWPRMDPRGNRRA